MKRKRVISYKDIDRIPKLALPRSKRRKLLEGKCRAVVTDILRKAGAKLPKAVRDKLEYKLVEIVRATQEIYDS